MRVPPFPCRVAGRRRLYGPSASSITRRLAKNKQTPIDTGTHKKERTEKNGIARIPMDALLSSSIPPAMLLKTPVIPDTLVYLNLSAFNGIYYSFPLNDRFCRSNTETMALLSDHHWFNFSTFNRDYSIASISVQYQHSKYNCI